MSAPISQMTRGRLRLHALASEANAPSSDFAGDVRAGLSREAKQLPCVHFYDEAGSQIFEEICALPEYYLTRAESSILEARAGEIIAALEPGAAIIELGSGSSTKTRWL